jgi:LacI family transcriptional regulator
VLGADRRPPRLKDVADAAGVHVSTASRALNEQTAALVNETTLNRVRQAASQLGYRVNGMARALKMQRSLSIGMIVPDITNPFFPPAVRGAEDVLDRAGFSLLLSSTDNDPARARRQVSTMLESQVDGMLLAMARREDSLVEELVAAGTPVVLVNRTIERGGVTAVVPDDGNGEAQAVQHLYGLGHRRIGFVAGPLFTSNAASRLASFGQGAAGLGLRAATTVEAEAFDEVAGYRAGSALLAEHPQLTAVIAGNDLLAIGVIEAAARQGLTCPRDLSVVGFNDMLLAGRVSPPLTTVRVPEYEIGARAAELLLAGIENPQRSVETVLFPCELIVRGSTAPPGRL